MRQLIKRSLVSAAVLASTLGFAGTVPALATADVASPSGCGQNDYVQSVDPDHPDEPYAQYTKIVVTPTEAAWHRVANRDVTVKMWHSIQACIPGLYGDVADSIWQQLMCHQAYPFKGPAGPTWDLETYHPPLSNPTWAALAATRCLNALEPEQGGASGGW